MEMLILSLVLFGVNKKLLGVRRMFRIFSSFSTMIVSYGPSIISTPVDYVLVVFLVIEFFLWKLCYMVAIYDCIYVSCEL